MTPGTKLGSYEILAPLGAGGMGEVYRARDAKLEREVAIKVLPASFAQNADRMARFRREAKVLASLNHPNIAAIYGVEDSGSTDALVMELVEGLTLSERLVAPASSRHAAGTAALPIDEALPMARQIADALEYAHERGVVHRDLKPANIKISRDDSVKILDFGLAKAVEGEATARVNGDSPTLSALATQAGVLLGTAGYMAPEQAKGKPVDRRADIWAFGCVLYEMLTGKKAFTGETTAETLAAVLANEPDWSQLPAATPVHVRVLLKRCLQKDPKQRLRDIGDARISLDEVLAGAPEAAPASAAPIWRRIMPWAIAGAFAIALAAVGFLNFRKRLSAPGAPMRFQIALPADMPLGFGLALSPDGRHLAFAGIGQNGRGQLWVRDLDSLASRPLPGTEGASSPFWSPDSHAIAFQSGSKLERVASSGGTPQVVCNIPSAVAGGSWNQHGVIVFGSASGLWKVSAEGGATSPLVGARPSPGEHTLINPSFLPDGRHFLYADVPAEEVYVGSLDAGAEHQPAKLLLAGSTAIYAPVAGSGIGQIVFIKPIPDGRLMAQAFDPARAELEGDPTPLAERVSSFAVASNGILAYIAGQQIPLQLAWFDGQGRVLGTLGDRGVYPTPAISPDGKTVAVPVPRKAGGEDLWLYDVAHGTRSRFTFRRKVNLSPVWSPDGSRIAFFSPHSGAPTVYEKAVDGIGQARPFENAPRNLAPMDWSRDGHYLIETDYGVTNSIWVQPLSPDQSGGAHNPVPYLKDVYSAINARLSPNEQWIAYDSDETGRDEIFVQTFPKPGGKWQVSTDGGTRPVWSHDGKELYFIGLDGNLMAVGVNSGPGGSFEADAPKALFNPHTGPVRTDTFDVSKDGRFLIPTLVGEPGNPITVVVNWQAALKK